MTPLYFLFSDSNKNNIYIKRDDLIPISFLVGIRQEKP